ncbi:apurinic/apyrimidinic endonuclease family protein [Microvirga arsenatis]|uniref:UV damage endonuclease UvsE n=1 Tax=Microvirga arsenatis TaxID=2692265 RepID=A0ABW9YXL4_9HYPH|nr:UV damage endonuclease UvsE [Microvirga arsenatis]NBJ11815.1 UV damage endonuclease UvsE [Microvirga arsenatis]NBJ25096.1 UV damage endonuclease UvsE [Microvirga arsenatis]
MQDFRFGFCCKYIPEDGSAPAARAMNTTTVTMAYLGRLEPKEAYDKLVSVVSHNLEAFRLQIEHVGTRPKLERLHRLSSDLLPGYTHPACQDFYRDPDLRGLIEARLAALGRTARERDVRLSMHPGQFCVIASRNPAAVANGIAEFEYHAEVMALMGYGEGWHPHGAHINIHGGAKALGADGIRKGLGSLSSAARNLITIENDEVSFGLDDLLPLADAVPLVLDLHHHWIMSQGEYIQPDDPRIARIVDSWRGVRPVSHVSVSREGLLPDHDIGALPDFGALVEAGIKPKDLRGHSDLMWNEALNDLVMRHLAWSDFEIEAKLKNIATEGLAQHVERRQGARTATG